MKNVSAVLCFAVIAGGMIASGMAAAQDIPPGTVLSVRTIEPIDARTADPNRRYAASLADPIELNGREVAPRYADVRLRVVAERPGSLFVQVADIRVYGRWIPVDVGSTVRLTSRHEGDAAKRGIIGGAIGAGLGALIGGGKGAAIGAGAGAGAGVASAMLRGGNVHIPAETYLEFTVNGPSQAAPPPPPPQEYRQEYRPAPPQEYRPERERDEHFTQHGLGFAVTIRECTSHFQGGVACQLWVRNEGDRDDREILIGGDSGIIERDGDMRRAVSTCLGENGCSQDWAAARISRDRPLHGRIEFARGRTGDRIGTLRLKIRAREREDVMEFHDIEVERQ